MRSPISNFTNNFPQTLSINSTSLALQNHLKLSRSSISAPPATTMQSSTVIGISPSFTTSHSSTNLADVAARVVEEFRHENRDDYDDIFNFNGYDHDYDDSNRFSENKSETNTPLEKSKEENSDTDDEDDDEFEFAVVSSDLNSSSISNYEILSPRYPLFDRSLLLDIDPNLVEVVNGSPEKKTDCNYTPSSLVVRLPLRKLFSEERDFSSSISSSEADDLDGINPGTYCVWKPKAESLPEKCKKSNSTGNSSRRWKFRDILYRSNSDGKESPFLLFKPLISTNKKIINDEKVKKIEKSAKVASAAGDGGSAVALKEANKAENGGSRRRRSYLPSGQALIGAFTNVSRSNRNLRPF